MGHRFENKRKSQEFLCLFVCEQFKFAFVADANLITDIFVRTNFSCFFFSEYPLYNTFEKRMSDDVDLVG